MGKAGHPAKVEADAVVMDRLHFHPQDLDILAEATWRPKWWGSYRGIPCWSARIPWHFHGAGNNQCNVVRVSMAQPMEVVFTIRALVLALASPTLLQATLQVSGMPVILERVRASVTVSTVPVGQGMAVFFLKQSGETTGETSAPSVALESPLLVPCVGCGMRACDVCCPFPARLCESCRITSCTPIGALISTVADKDRYHHECNTVTLPPEPTADKLREWIDEIDQSQVPADRSL